MKLRDIAMIGIGAGFMGIICGIQIHDWLTSFLGGADMLFAVFILASTGGKV